MDNFTYQCQTRFIFGKDTEKLVGEETKKYSTRILLHYGTESIKKSGLYEKIISSLKDSKITYFELPGVVPNPRLGLVKEGITLCRKNKIDFILAVGGGSVIDSAKAIAVGVPYKGEVWDFFSKRTNIKKALPVGVILTLPASGSEASSNAVITNEEQHRKLVIGSNLIRPVFSIMNPELTFTLSKFQTACGIADMMAHIFERYFSNSSGVDLTDKLCEATLRSIIKNSKLVIKEPNNYEYRANLMWAGTIAHGGILGVGRSEDWASHVIEHELSAFYDIAHGAGLAVIFPAWMKYVYKQKIEKFSQFGREVWGISSGTEEEIALKSIENTKKFFSELGLPITLKELKIDRSKPEQMSKLCTSSGKIGNFVKLDAKDVLEIYKLALG